MATQMDVDAPPASQAGVMQPDDNYKYFSQQTADERREIRSKQREVASQLQADRDKISQPSNRTALELLRTEGAVFQNVRTGREAAADAHILREVSDIGVEQARRLRASFQSFSDEDFATKLVSFMRGGTGDAPVRASALDWAKLGAASVQRSRRVPTVDFMLGPLEIKQRLIKRTVHQKVERDPAKLKKPVQLTEDEIRKSENETTKHVKHVYGCLKAANGPVNYFVFVTNPKSFSQTIENIFYVAFLVRDGRATLSIGADGQPYLEPAMPRDASAPDHAGPSRQLIIELTMEQYRDIIKLYQVRDTMIPHRLSQSR